MIAPDNHAEIQALEADRGRYFGYVHNKNLSTKIRVALPPGNYRVQQLRAGPFAPVDEQNVELKSGEDTILSWARGDGFRELLLRNGSS